MLFWYNIFIHFIVYVSFCNLLSQLIIAHGCHFIWVLIGLPFTSILVIFFSLFYFEAGKTFTWFKYQNDRYISFYSIPVLLLFHSFPPAPSQHFFMQIWENMNIRVYFPIFLTKKDNILNTVLYLAFSAPQCIF